MSTGVNWHENLGVLIDDQVLQTFHKAQPYKGSPLKAEDLQKVRENSYELLFEPRSPEDRNVPDKRDRFRNVCFNLQAKERMPVMQMFPPANPIASAHDHIYCLLSPENQFLKDAMISEITPTQQALVEKQTRGQAASKAWKEERLKRITASKYGTICKATDNRDMIALARSLTEYKDIRAPAILHGRKYESVAVEAYSTRQDIETKESGLFVSLEKPMLAATPDRLIDDNVLVEVKCPFTSKDKPINPVNVPYLLVVDGSLTLKKSHDYYYQIQGQLYCTGRKMCHFVVYTLCDMVVIEIPRDDQFIQSMVSTLMKFYNKFFRDAVLNKLLYKNYNNYTFEY